MKRNLMLAATALTLGTLSMDHAAADSVGGALVRNSNFSPTQSSGCLSSWVGLQRVQVITTLSTFGTVVDIAPNATCWRRQRSHHVDVITDCFSGAQFHDTRSGTALVDADVRRDCRPSGGKDALWTMNAF